MNEQIRDALSCSIRGFRLPRYHEIPDVGYYLEQTTKYVNQCIRPLGIEDVTSSMIRNYVKQGLITNPIHKQYSANQIAHLIALALLKQVSPWNISAICSDFSKRAIATPTRWLTTTSARNWKTSSTTVSD